MTFLVAPFLVLVTMALLAPVADAAPPMEAWCEANPAICVCHRTLRATGWSQTGIPPNTWSKWWAENDQNVSDPKLCGEITSAGTRGINLGGSGNPSESLSVVVTPNVGSAVTVAVPSYGGVYPAGQTNAVELRS